MKSIADSIWKMKFIVIQKNCLLVEILRISRFPEYLTNYVAGDPFHNPIKTCIHIMCEFFYIVLAFIWNLKYLNRRHSKISQKSIMKKRCIASAAPSFQKCTCPFIQNNVSCTQIRNALNVLNADQVKAIRCNSSTFLKYSTMRFLLNSIVFFLVRHSCNIHWQLIYSNCYFETDTQWYDKFQRIWIKKLYGFMCHKSQII